MFPKNRKTWANKSSVYTVTPATYQNTTLYVSTTGNDANNGLSASKALATIQEAVDRIPKYIQHNVTINVGAGSFSSFYLDSFYQESGTFLINGTLADATLATGTVSGISTGGSTTTLVDAGQNWTVNDLIGNVCLVAGEYRVIHSNTINTITFAGNFSATTSGKAYHIYLSDTIITGENSYTKVSDSATYKSSILVRNCKFNNAIISKIRTLATDNNNRHFYLYNSNGLSIKECYATGINAADTNQRGFCLENSSNCDVLDCVGTTHYYGVDTTKSYGCNISRNRIYGSAIGFYFCECTVDNSSYLFANTCSTHGFHIYGKNSFVNGSSWNSTSNTSYGIFVQGNLLLASSTINLNSYGIVVGESTDNLSGTLEITSATTISNSTNDGILGNDGAYLNARYASGTGNGGYGVRCKNKCILIHSNGNTTITGTTGKYTLDDGITPAADWTTNFSSNGDTVYELTTSTLAVRRD